MKMLNRIPLLIAITTILFPVVSIEAQDTIAVGSGSYASFPPPQANAGSLPTQSAYVVTTNGVPIPTNKWWTDLIMHQYAGKLWAYPLTVSADAQGINIYHPINWVPSGTTPQLALNSPISIRGRGFAPADARALRWGDWTVAFRLQQFANQLMDVTIGHGLPYVWVEFTGVQPQISFASGVTYFDDTATALSLPLTTDHFGISYPSLGSSHYFGVFAPDNTQFVLSNGVINVTFAGTNQFLVVSVLSAPTDLAYFSQFAYAVPRDSQMNWGYDPVTGVVTTRWHLATQVLQGTEPRVIQGWLAHHWRDTTNDLTFNGINYSTARGPMKCATGTDFQILYPFPGIPPTLPAPVSLGKPNDYVPSRMNSYIASAAANTNLAPDTYWAGKDMLRWAQHMAFAHELGRPEFATLENTLRLALQNWYTYTPNESTDYFAAYPAWKALVGFQSSYGSEQFADQHFHYGYFAHASALLGMYDRAFLQDYGSMARLVAKEYANWDRNDPDFPFLRTFDIWSGHSQASGFPDSGRGGNQESSSEAVQSWGGLFLLGAMMGDDQMRAAGAMGYAMESSATREYWFDEHGDVWPPVYAKSIVGILWDNGQDFQTYFGANPIYIHGIQWFPISPVLSYLVRDPEFARDNYNNMLTEQLNQMGENSISSMGAQWGNYALDYALQFDPDSVAAQMDALYAAGDPVATDPFYAGVTYYFTHATRRLGSIQWQFHISVPTSAVYYNTNSAQLFCIAYNPLTNSQVATVYSNNVAIDTLALPPLTLVTQTLLQSTNLVTIVTNPVPAVIVSGVVIRWPTMVSTNYQAQWAGDLTPNTSWTNLAEQRTGDGTTNSLFDPFEPYDQKFYRVLAIGWDDEGGSSGGNLLLNPGFEAAGTTASNAVNWTVAQASGGPVSALRTNRNPHSGSFHYEIHLASVGAGPVVQLQQSNVPVTGGTANRFSFYANRLTGSAGDNDQYNIQWFGPGLLGQTGFIGYAPGANVYSPIIANGLIAPTNATSATVIFYFAGAASPSQSATIQIDDVSLANTNSMASGGSGITNQVQAGIIRATAVGWFASNNVPYQVQWASDTNTWNNLGSPVMGTGSSNTVVDTSGQPEHTFYRVLSIQ
jgi:endoglucanase Acf2